MKFTDPRVAVGWWYSGCCEEDLVQIEDEAEVARMREAASNEDWMLTYDCWPTLDAALDALNKDWTPERREAIKAAKLAGKARVGTVGPAT